MKCEMKTAPNTQLPRQEEHVKEIRDVKDCDSNNNASTESASIVGSTRRQRLLLGTRPVW
jgi:hypothetical protein